MSRWGVFILSHGRASNVKTAKLLEKSGFNGEWRIVVDDEDEQGEEYRRLYGDRVILFRKGEYMEKTQTVAPTSDRPKDVVVYARNAAPDIARSLGWDYFIELDDDYDRFEHRWVEGSKLKTRIVYDVHGIFSSMIKFLEQTKADVIALAQGGDFIGGAGSTGARKRFLRKAMNVYAFRSSTDIRFTGALNEDLTMSVLEGSKGRLILTCTACEVQQMQTQAAGGGFNR